MTAQDIRAVRAVLFDLDDTLFDHRYAARCVLQDLQSTHRCLQDYSLEFLENEDFRLLDEKHALVMAGLIDVDASRTQRVQSLFALCGEEISTDYARELARRRQAVYRESRRPVPGAIPLLQVLKDRVSIGIVTNNFTSEQQEKLEACGLTTLVDLLVTSEEVRRTKPDPEIFRAAIHRLGCHANEAVMVGDSWESDVIGALNAGIRPVWFNRHGGSNPRPGDVVEITSFEPVEVAAGQIIGTGIN